MYDRQVLTTGMTNKRASDSEVGRDLFVLSNARWLSSASAVACAHTIVREVLLT